MNKKIPTVLTTSTGKYPLHPLARSRMSTLLRHLSELGVAGIDDPELSRTDVFRLLVSAYLNQRRVAFDSPIVPTGEDDTDATILSSDDDDEDSVSLG